MISLQVKKFGMNKIAAMIIKISKALIIVIFLLLHLKCKTKEIEYFVSDSYSGPVVIFIHSSKISLNESDSIIINRGLGKIREKQMKNRSLIKSLETGLKLDIVPIGDEKNSSDSIRCVYRLVNSISGSGCSNEDLYTLRFFVGYKSDYERWSERYTNELDYFDSRGINWCNYYTTSNP